MVRAHVGPDVEHAPREGGRVRSQDGELEIAMSKTRLFGWSLSFVFLLGCSKNTEVAEFVKENDALVKELGEAASADQAKQVFDNKKAALAAKLEPIKDARGFQINQASQEALGKSLMDGATTVCGLQLKAIGNQADGEKYKALCDDYGKVLKME